MTSCTFRWIAQLLIVSAAGAWSPACSADENEATLGTAFFIRRDGAMLTNRHVVKDCKHVFVIPEDGNPYPVSILAISREYDLAVLMVHGYTPKSFVPIRAAQDKRYVSIPEDGEEVVTGGFSNPDAMKLAISIVDGITLALPGYSERGSINSVMLSSVGRGASGSAVIDHSGNLVGVIHSGVEDLDKVLSGKLEKFNSAVYFHNNNAIADFLTKEGIQFHFRQSARQLNRVLLVGFSFNITALVDCRR